MYQEYIHSFFQSCIYINYTHKKICHASPIKKCISFQTLLFWSNYVEFRGCNHWKSSWPPSRKDKDLPNLLKLGSPKNWWHWSLVPTVGLLHEVTPRNLGGKSGTISLHINMYLYIHIWYVLTNYAHIYILIFVYVYIHMLPLLGVGKLIVYDLSMPERKHMPTVIWIVLIVPLSHMSHPISQAFGLWFSRLF